MSTVLRGKCIDTTISNNLDTVTIYYLFEHNSKSYYVSRFNSVRSHMGAYQKKRFKIVESEEINTTSNETHESFFINEDVRVTSTVEETKEEEISYNQLSLFDLD